MCPTEASTEPPQENRSCKVREIELAYLTEAPTIPPQENRRSRKKTSDSVRLYDGKGWVNVPKQSSVPKAHRGARGGEASWGQGYSESGECCVYPLRCNHIVGINTTCRGSTKVSYLVTPGSCGEALCCSVSLIKVKNETLQFINGCVPLRGSSGWFWITQIQEHEIPDKIFIVLEPGALYIPRSQKLSHHF